MNEVVYDLNSLQHQYGDLYLIVELLSKEKVEGRFDYLVRYLVDEGHMHPIQVVLMKVS